MRNLPRETLWISCGGRGSRMKDLFRDPILDIPKHTLLIPTPGFNLIGEVLRGARGHFQRIRIVASASNVKYFVGMFEHDPDVTVDIEKNPTGPLGPAVRETLSAQERSYLCGGDIFCEFDWDSVEDFHDGHEFPVTILLAKSCPMPSAACFVVEGSTVLRWDRKEMSDHDDLINIGIYIIDPQEELCSLMRQLTRHKEDPFFSLLVSNHMLAAYVSHSVAYNVNTPATYQALLADLERNKEGQSREWVASEI